MPVPPTDYTSTFSKDEEARLWRWHEAAYDEMRKAGRRRLAYLGLELVVPGGVFAPTPMSDLLGRSVLEEARETDRVLDMGTGSGVNAILAASRARDVVGIDINPQAVAAAVENAERNGVSSRTSFLVGDLFDAVVGQFDLVVYDPPFRWFRPRDLLEASIADDGYRSLTRFMHQVPDFLRPGGCLLVFFGTSGDLGYFTQLVDAAKLTCATVAERSLTREGLTVTYSTFRCSR